MLGGTETFNSEDHADTSLSLGPGERFVRRAYLNLQMRPAQCSFSLTHSENGGRSFVLDRCFIILGIAALERAYVWHSTVISDLRSLTLAH